MQYSRFTAAIIHPLIGWKFVVSNKYRDHYDACVNISLGHNTRLDEFKSRTHSQISSRGSPAKYPEYLSSGK